MKISFRWIKKYIDIDESPSSMEEIFNRLGFQVKTRENIKTDVVWDVVPPLQRADVLGHIGIARELSVVAGIPLKEITWPLAEGDDEITDSLDVQVWEEDQCPRYCAILVRGVTVEPSPLWLQDSIRAMGLSPVNHVVDITNYVLFSTGHPVHAYDLDKLEGRKIFIRKATAEETLHSLDGREISLTTENLVVADERKPLALAGIVGGIDTAVTAATKDVLIESACFNPYVIRRGEKYLGFQTEASLRFGRDIDISFTPLAAKLTASFLTQMGARASRGLLDVYPRKRKARTVVLRQHRIAEILGVEVEEEFIHKILSGLGYQIAPQQPGIWRVKVPLFRSAVERETDLIQDIARFYDYNRIPSNLSGSFSAETGRSSKNSADIHLRRVLFHEGFDEVLNDSFLPADKVGILTHGCQPMEAGSVGLRKPVFLRATLLGGLLANAVWNLNRGSDGVAIFEMGEIFFKADDTDFEQRNLAFLTTGMQGDVHWRSRPEPADFFRLKGACEALMHTLGYASFSFLPARASYFVDGRSLALQVKGKQVGELGRIKPEILEAFGVKGDVWAAEINLTALLEMQPQSFKYVPVKKFPCVIRDISFLTDQEVIYQQIKQSIEKLSVPYLERFELYDLFTGDPLPDKKISMAFRFTFCHPQRTLHADEVSDSLRKIIKMLQADYKFQLREGGEN